MADIHKAAGVVIKDKKLLVVRAYGKEHFFSPGGKIEAGETALQAVIRELEEEISIICKQEDLDEIGVFHAVATDRPELTLEQTVFMVKNYTGEIQASHEIEALRWINSSDENDPLLGSIFAHEILPKLKEQGLVE